ncbi:putative ABC transporter ATP-binding protein C29A3.09c [Drechslerella stenobrocha 248]|uniref:Putative ABC transporter ATP-binding protein C29A3.09c n=1 Tax=Drechslerella stenobrocha 248 TaxID=1043628 RepID=W7HJB2_9PEZI|nr:putative ABC transporter ATP-binding protein C29A3.09c [Drechslerella stenobrocha 248]
MAVETQLLKAIPGLDNVLTEYCVGFLKYAINSELPEADDELQNAVAAVTAILQSAAMDTPPESIAATVDSMVKRLMPAEGLTKRSAGASTNRKLEQTINMASRSGVSGTMNLVASVDLEATAFRKVESRVDKKKLEKAERKIKAKQDKKLHKNVEYEASKLISTTTDTKSYEEFYMLVNPLQLGNASAGKSKDIKVENVDVQISGKRILTDTTLTLAYGRRYGLVGQNGIGKSTLLRALSKRELNVPTHISILHVEQEITGDDTPALQAVLDADVWRKHLLAEQDRLNNLLTELENTPLAQQNRPDLQSKEELGSLLSDVHEKLAEMESDKAESRAASILFGLGFSAETQQFATRTFSGGWRMRLALARALFCKPDLLLLDEPSNMLDVPSIVFLSEYLQGYPSTVLVVSHDRAFLNEVATDIIHQHSERLDYYKGGNFDSFYATKEERRKTAIREYENQMAVRKHLQTFIDKFRYNAAKSSEAQSRIKKLEKLPVLEPPEAEYSVHFAFPGVEKLSPPIMQMSGVAFSYREGVPIVSNVDLDVQLDSRIGIVGPNGAGKTTVLKLLTGQLQPTAGMISRNGRLRVGYFAQHNLDYLDPKLSALTFCAREFPGKTDEDYRRHLGAFGITGTVGLQRMELLSGGQKSRVAFACLGLTNPQVLVLDEPTNHLDVEAMDALSDALRNFEGGVLMVSHDVTILQNVCTSLWVCEGGRVEHFEGTVKQYKKRILDQAKENGVVQQH